MVPGSADQKHCAVKVKHGMSSVHSAVIRSFTFFHDHRQLKLLKIKRKISINYVCIQVYILAV